MHTTNEDVIEVLKALDQAKANVPKDWDYLSNEVIPCCPIGNFHFDFYERDLDQYVKKN